MKMAEKLGLDPQKFYEISSQSSGYNWSLNAYTPMPGVGVDSPAVKDYQGGFATALMLKDLRLAMEAADNADAAVPLSSRAAALYEDFAGAGNDGLDFSAIIKTY
jgi:3-hydroxyisobutyrate dehydrogenase